MATERYRITIPIEVVQGSAHRYANRMSPEEGVEFDVPEDPSHTHLRVRQFGEQHNDVRVEVEIDADTDDQAERPAHEVLRSFLRMKALAKDAVVIVPPGRSAKVQNMSQPSRLYPRMTVSATLYHLQGDEVERVWQQLAMMNDASLQEALTLVLDWLYIGSLASDARTAFLTYWMAFEYLLNVGHERHRSERLSKWLRERVADMRTRAPEVQLSDEELSAFYALRCELVHEAGSGRLGETLTDSTANHLRQILTGYVKALLASGSL